MDARALAPGRTATGRRAAQASQAGVSHAEHDPAHARVHQGHGLVDGGLLREVDVIPAFRGADRGREGQARNSSIEI
jgi:hypothetical protein